MAAMATHHLAVNPHPDLQLVTYAFEFLQSLREGNLAEYFTTPHKYPFLPVFLLSILYGGTIGSLFLFGILPSIQEIEQYLFMDGPRLIFFESRLLMLASAVGTLLLLSKLSQHFFPKSPKWYAPALLCSSVLFLLFSTAIRPHILVTFATTLALYFSVRAYESTSSVSALSAAGLAFATLQNGLFAFWFPLWSLCKKWTLRSLLRPSVWLSILCTGIIATFISYPFLWTKLLRGGLDSGLAASGNPYFSGFPFDGSGFWILGHVLLGDSIFIVLCALLGGAVLWKTKRTYLTPILLYLGTYVLLFGSMEGIVMRFFLPIIPILALLGAGGLPKLPRVLRGMIFGVIILTNLKLAWLGLQPNTYQLAREFLVNQTQGVVSTTLAQSFLDIPSTRVSIGEPKMYRERYWLSLDEDLPNARVFVQKEQWQEADIFLSRVGNEPEPIHTSPDWKQCAEFGSTSKSRDGLLWSDIGYSEDFLLPRLFQLKKLGPTIRVYCRK